jgi:hypothetical protein
MLRRDVMVMILAVFFLIPLPGRAQCWRQEALPPDIVRTRPHMAIAGDGRALWGATGTAEEIRLLRKLADSEPWTSTGTIKVRGFFQNEMKMVVLPDGRPLVAYVSLEAGAIEVSIFTWERGAFAYYGRAIEAAPKGDRIVNLNLIATIGGEAYVAWEEVGATTVPRVLQWRESDWHELGPGGVGGRRSGIAPSLAIDADGHPWLAWNDPSRIQGANTKLRIARHGGTDWRDVDLPADLRVQEGYYLKYLGLHQVEGAMTLIVSQSLRDVSQTLMFKWSPQGWRSESLPPELARAVVSDASDRGGNLALAWMKTNEAHEWEVHVATKDAHRWRSLAALRSNQRTLEVDIAGMDVSGVALAVVKLKETIEIGNLVKLEVCDLSSK